MFEYNIDEGMPVSKFEYRLDEHGRDFIKVKIGTVWKLRLHCCVCKGIFDDCWCFSTKELMEEAKSKKWYCSASCHIRDNPDIANDYLDLIHQEITGRGYEFDETEYDEIYSSGDLEAKLEFANRYSDELQEIFSCCDDEIIGDEECPL